VRCSAEPRRGDTPYDLRAWRERLLSHVAVGCLGLSTARETFTTTCRFYAYLFRRGLAPADFSAQVRRIRCPRNRHVKDPLSVEQARGLVTAVQDDGTAALIVRLRDLAYLLLKLHTGVRDIEVVRANVGHLQLRTDGLAELAVHGKGRDAADEIVLLTAEALAALRDYLTARGVWDHPSVPLVVSHSDRSAGQRITSRGLREIVRRRLEQAGLKSARVTGHSLRHTAATLALSNGSSGCRRCYGTRAPRRRRSTPRVDRVSGAAELAILRFLDVSARPLPEAGQCGNGI
jgi:site-specific recombinase XerD